MTEVLSALAPVFAVILVGFAGRRLELVPQVFWEPAERVTFYLFFPTLLVSTIAGADLRDLQVAPMLLASLGAIALVVALAFAVRRLLRLDGPALSSLIQSGIRPNVYVALAAAAALYGDAGLTLASVCLAVIVPFVNAIAVLALVRHAAPGGAPLGWRRTAAPVLQNPLILACLAGLALNLSGLGLPPVIGPTLEILGRASLPIALLAVGAGLDPGAVRAAGPAVAVASGLKLVVLPLLTLALSRALGAGAGETAIAVLYASVPVSVTAYVMARQMGGDSAIMAGSITASTLAAMVTMPAVLLLV